MYHRLTALGSCFIGHAHKSIYVVAPSNRRAPRFQEKKALFVPGFKGYKGPNTRSHILLIFRYSFVKLYGVFNDIRQICDETRRYFFQRPAALFKTFKNLN